MPVQHTYTPIYDPMTGQITRTQITTTYVPDAPKGETVAQASQITPQEALAISRAGGGVVSTIGRTMYIKGEPQEKKVIEVETETKEGEKVKVQLPISKGVAKKIEKAGGLEEIYRRQYMMRLRYEGAQLLHEAVKSGAKGEDVLYQTEREAKMSERIRSRELQIIEEKRKDPIFQTVFAVEKIFTGEALAYGVQYMIYPEKEKLKQEVRAMWTEEQRSILYQLGKGQRGEVLKQRAPPMIASGILYSMPLVLPKVFSVIPLKLGGAIATGIGSVGMGVGTIQVATGHQKALRGEPSTVGAGLITMGASAFLIKSGWKMMFPMKLETPTHTLTAKERSKYEKLMRQAEKLEHARPPVKELNLKEVSRLPPKARQPLLKYLRSEKDVVVGGTVGQRTQLYGKIKRPLMDIDLFATSPAKSSAKLHSIFSKLGIKSKLVISHRGEIAEAGKIWIGGKKAIEFHTHAFRRVFEYLEAPRTTPSGIKVISITEQMKRKIVGGVIFGRGYKDIPHFHEIRRSVVKSVKLGHHKGTAYPFGLYNLYKQTFVVPFYPVMKTPYYKKPSISMPYTTRTTLYKPLPPQQIRPYIKPIKRRYASTLGYRFPSSFLYARPVYRPPRVPTPVGAVKPPYRPSVYRPIMPFFPAFKKEKSGGWFPKFDFKLPKFKPFPTKIFKRRYKYTPSFEALMLGFVGKKPRKKYLLGWEFRPIPRRRKKRRKRKK